MATQVHTLTVGPFMENCYLFWDEASSDAVVIDPGDEAERILDDIGRRQLKVRAILLTHGHLDHIAAVGEIKQALDVPIYIGRGEEILLSDPAANGSAAYGMPITAPPADKLLDHEDVVQLGTIRLLVLATPGHSPAGICYLDETGGRLFCGDTLFMQSIGRTDLYGASLDKLMESIQQQILSLPDSVVCYPGHGPSTTVGAERTGNPFLTGGYFV